MICNFQRTLKEEFNRFFASQQNRFPSEDILKIDLHCHDYNSDVPDEPIGRILHVPETWLTTENLLERLNRNGCNVFTITNHNNARSCYALQDKGIDILTGAEFSCKVPDFETGIHVLAYGFTPEQEAKLNQLRKNLYPFLEYAHANQIPTIWGHPLFHYSAKKMPPAAFFNKMLLVFERFEVLNGQRDAWQNLLVKDWLEQITPDKIDQYARESGIDPWQFCTDPYRKSISGGSDCHTGLFAGMTGSHLYVPDLQHRLTTCSRSQLALEAIRKGDIAPYGAYYNMEKMTIGFLNYACEIALHYKDPGLARLLLYKGKTKEKLTAFVLSNLFSEVKRKKTTTSLIRTFSNCMRGEKPHKLTRLFVKTEYKPLFDEAVHIADIYKENNAGWVDEYYQSILKINHQLYDILLQRLGDKLQKINTKKHPSSASVDALIEKLELPSSIRSYLKKKKNSAGVSKFLKGLSFPFFGTSFVLAAHFTSARTLFKSRPLLRDFSNRLGRLQQPERILWLTDTFGDENHISVFLKEMLDEIRQKDLPVDIVTCSSTVSSGNHLIALQPVKEFPLPDDYHFTIRVPDFVELHNLFLNGGYDRIFCSTEGLLGIFGLYLKHAYTVEATFYKHTDWLLFAQEELHFQKPHLKRIRRILRSFYKSFDNTVDLNSDFQDAGNSILSSFIRLRQEQGQ